MFPFIWYLWGLYFSFSGWTNTCILWLSSFFSQNSFRLSWIYFSSFWKFIFQLYRPKNIEIDTLCKRSPWPRQLWAPAEQTEIFQWKWDRRSRFFLWKRFCCQWSALSSLRRLIFTFWSLKVPKMWGRTTTFTKYGGMVNHFNEKSGSVVNLWPFCVGEVYTTMSTLCMARAFPEIFC